ncbi:MFS transporter [Variovorax sp. dw_308]|uniref:MFS transporter n=1 Tax=Variovorax sp. dw_308 TaxID=2721546 RepID=UPI001C482624|nr:MFS transporter [Variovorax sp. dw_308]
MNELETRTIRKVMRRIVPFLILCYFVAYLDRVNVGFAKLQMNAALGLSETAYALGAGLFFVAYFLLEVPSNLALNRFGARLWIARIMASWGLVSALFAFIDPISKSLGVSNEVTFYTLRFLLGVMEAGFYPGVIFYLTLWFPAIYRARVVSLFMLAIPFSSILGAPLSGALLGITGAGMAGWQWLFVLEAAPSVLLSIGVIFYLTDRPVLATWLNKEEIEWLDTRLAQEAKEKVAAGHGHLSLWQSISNPRILACASVYFCLNAASYGVAFFLPSIIKGFGVSNLQAGFLAALPFVFGAIGMVTLSRNSDRTLKRREHVAFALALAAVGVAGAGMVSAPVLILGLLCLGQIGVSSVPPLFWPIPSSFLTGASAAAGIAAINSIGNLSGFFGPYMMGYLHDKTGSFTTGLIMLGSVAAIGTVIALRLKVESETPSAGVAPKGAVAH